MSVIISQTQRPTLHAMYAKNTVPHLLIEATENITVQLKYWPYDDRDNVQWNDADIVFTGSYSPDFNGEIDIDFGELYGAYLSTVIPTNDSTELDQSPGAGYFHLLISGSDSGAINTNSLRWYVANAKLKSSQSFQSWSMANFLTNQPIEKVTNYESPEWLTWIDYGSGCDLIARFYRKNGESIEITVRSATDAGVFSANVRYSRLIQMANVTSPSQLQGFYDLILVNSKQQEVACQRYIYEERTGMEKYFLFVNALGGIDTLICQGENVLQPNTAHNIGRFSDHYRALDDTDDKRRWNQNTGMVPTQYRNWIYELLTNKQGAQKYDPAALDYYSIVVDQSDVSMSDHGQLSQASFGYILDETVNVISDTERAVDRMLHQSVAEQAEAFDDVRAKQTAVMQDDGHGGFETNELIIPASTIYVNDNRTFKSVGEPPVYYYLNGSQTAAGSFSPGSEDNPTVINKQASDSISFSTQNENIELLEIKYYPTQTT